MIGDVIQNRVRGFAGALLGLKTPKQILEIAAYELAQVLGCERVCINFLSEEASFHVVWAGEPSQQTYQSGFELVQNKFQYGEMEVGLPLVINDVARSAYPQVVTHALEKASISSLMIFGLASETQTLGWVEVHSLSRFRRWRKEDYLLLKALCDNLALFLKQSAEVASLLKRERHYRQMLENIPSAVIEFDQTCLILYRNRAASQKFAKLDDMREVLSALAISPAKLQGQFNQLISGKQASLSYESSDSESVGVNIEFQTLTPATQEGVATFLAIISEVKTVAVEVVKELPPVQVDTKPSQQLIDQNRRVEALYEVAQALQFSTDPAVVTLKGLKAVVKATNSDGGVAFLYDRSARRLELVASEGVSAAYVDAIEKTLEGYSLVRHVAESGEGLLMDNMQHDPRARVEVAKIENVQAAILQPLMHEGQVLGELMIFCREAGRYNTEDFDLVRAATSQIAVAARQAELYTSSKRQANSLAALYRLSHELSQYLTVEEVSQHAFKILHEVLACKRMWLGVMNEQRTHIKGHAGFGPGVRKPLIDVQIELNLRHDFLDEALSRREPIIVPENAKAECSGLNRIMRNLKLGAFVVLPLISLGQVVGILVIEPAVAQGFFNENKLSLLNSMASEIAAVILARKFEARIAESDKMRMAGLLASGVAHNFNNLLQAIMGQASLIQLQLDPNSPLNKSSKMILDAAERGGQLVRQLMAFSQPTTMQKKVVSVNQLLQDSHDFYRSILGASIDLKYDIRSDAPLVEADYSQLQQALTNMLINAKEAIPEGRAGVVKLSTVGVRLRSNEVDPELAPGYYLRVNLEDNGLGMDEEKRSRCFEPFFTTKNVDKSSGVGIGGSGLGLSSAYSLVKQHQGLITVQSYVGEGSVFSVYLPAVESKPASIESPSLDKQVQVERNGHNSEPSPYLNGNGVHKTNGVALGKSTH